MSSQYGELRPTNGRDRFGSLGHPANFNGFRVLTSLLHRCRSTEVNQTLHDVWPSPGLAHYMYIYGGSYPLREFCQVQNSPCVQVLRFPILTALCTAREQWALAKLCGMVQGMELRNTRSSSFLTEGATHIPRATITLGIDPHSSSLFFPYLFQNLFFEPQSS